MLLKIRDVIIRIYRIANTLVWKRACFVGTHARIFEGCSINNKGTLHIGNNALIQQYTSISLKENAVVEIGDFSSIGPYSQITAMDKIAVGSGVMTGPMLLITDNSHGSFILEDLKRKVQDRPVVSKGSVMIGNNVWIGAKVSILPGVSIGEGSVIGANAVVTQNIPPFSLAVGNPAKVVKKLCT